MEISSDLAGGTNGTRSSTELTPLTRAELEFVKDVELYKEAGKDAIKLALGTVAMKYGPGLVRQAVINTAVFGYRAFEAWVMQDD